MSDQESAEYLERLCLEDFKLWSPIALKTFLSLRKKDITVSFDTLVARAFAVYEENVKVDPEAEHKQRVILSDYISKLCCDGKPSLPDPMELKHGWVSEALGMQLWPKLCIADISRYYEVTLLRKTLVYRLECDYKEGKAYWYCGTGFVQPMFYNNLIDDDECCFLKSKCLPSQRVSSKPYDVWAIMKKDTKNLPGGEIKAAYCTCTARLLGSCNHVAGMLFRVEAAVITGIAHPTCTGVSSRWNLPHSTIKIIPGRLSSFVSGTTNYSKMATEKTKKEKLEMKKKREEFSVMSKTQSESLKDEDATRKTILELIKDDVPNSCFVQLLNVKQKPVQQIPHLSCSMNIIIKMKTFEK